MRLLLVLTELLLTTSVAEPPSSDEEVGPTRSFFEGVECFSGERTSSIPRMLGDSPSWGGGPPFGDGPPSPVGECGGKSARLKGNTTVKI